MVTREIRDRAARLGLSAWVTYAIAATRDGRERMLELKCVGFSSADLALAEGETWSEVFDEAALVLSFGHIGSGPKESWRVQRASAGV